MKAYRIGFVISVITFFFAAVGSAQTQTAPASSYRSDYIAQLDDAEKKLLSLAEAVPADKFSWRPADDVRSVSEVYMHIAGANFLFPKFAGIDPPAGINRDMEKSVTDKAKVLEAMKQSFQHLRQAFEKTPDSEMERKVKFFSGDASIRYVFLVAAMHCHEHLGQSIAYARINGVVPPWSAAE